MRKISGLIENFMEIIIEWFESEKENGLGIRKIFKDCEVDVKIKSKLETCSVMEGKTR